MKESAQLRPILAVIAWKVFKDHPVLGCGMGQYRQVAKYHLTDRNIDMPLEKVRPYVQHNIFLALLTEAGLVGAALFTAIMAIWTRWAWKIWRCRDLVLEYRQLGLVFLGFLAGYLANGMFQDVLIIPMVNMYYFFLGGCIRNLACHPQLEVSTRFAPIPARLSPSAAETFSPTVAPGGV
jgi:O-antigen ligase